MRRFPHRPHPVQRSVFEDLALEAVGACLGTLMTAARVIEQRKVGAVAWTRPRAADGSTCHRATWTPTSFSSSTCWCCASSSRRLRPSLPPGSGHWTFRQLLGPWHTFSTLAAPCLPSPAPTPSSASCERACPACTSAPWTARRWEAPATFYVGGALVTQGRTRCAVSRAQPQAGLRSIHPSRHRGLGGPAPLAPRRPLRPRGSRGRRVPRSARAARRRCASVLTPPFPARRPRCCRARERAAADRDAAAGTRVLDGGVLGQRLDAGRVVPAHPGASLHSSPLGARPLTRTGL